MNEVIQVIGKAARESASKKNMVPILEAIAPFLKDQSRMEGLSILRRGEDVVVFETGSGRKVEFGFVFKGREVLQFGGDDAVTTLIAFVFMCYWDGIPIDVTANTLQGMITGFKENAR